MKKQHYLEKLIQSLDMSLNGFEKSIGAGNSTVGRIIETKGYASPNLADKIVKAYPHVNRNWLLTSEGKMFISVEGETNYKEKYYALLEQTIVEMKAREERILKVLESLKK